MPRPRKFYDEGGWARVTLKKGSPRQPGGERPHAQYVQDGGLRVNQYGLRVKRTAIPAFAPIQWDLEDEPEDLGEGADEELAPESVQVDGGGIRFDEVAAFAALSPSLLASLSALDARAFALEEGPRGEGNQTLLGAGRILIDAEEVDKTSVTAVVAREVARLLAAQPKVAARGRGRAEFAAQNAAASVREEGEGVLGAYVARCEILAGGGPDIGVPGANEAVMPLLEALRLGQAPRAQATLEVGRGALAPLVEDAEEHYVALWGNVYDRVVGPGGLP